MDYIKFTRDYCLTVDLTYRDLLLLCAVSLEGVEYHDSPQFPISVALSKYCVCAISPNSLEKAINPSLLFSASG